MYNESSDEEVEVCNEWADCGECNYDFCTRAHPEICRNWRDKGHCRFGERCRRFHVRRDDTEDEEEDYDCKEEEDEDENNEMELCRDWERDGRCVRGDRCNYSHPEICRRWAKGHCKFGNRCRFFHTDERFNPPKPPPSSSSSSSQPPCYCQSFPPKEIVREGPLGSFLLSRPHELNNTDYMRRVIALVDGALTPMYEKVVSSGGHSALRRLPNGTPKLVSIEDMDSYHLLNHVLSYVSVYADMLRKYEDEVEEAAQTLLQFRNEFAHLRLSCGFTSEEIYTAFRCLSTLARQGSAAAINARGSSNNTVST
eukprot:m.117243 g.117243  ORF g.117243 m.117243 type:complete len:311 (+) comp12870_c1_seq1:2472-3404(+)